MLQNMEDFPPTSSGGIQEIAAVRIDRVNIAGVIGSVPLGDAQEVDETVVLFMDKLGARAAFERTGVRLYQALITKYEAYGSFRGGPSEDELKQFLADEQEHFLLAAKTIQSLGGDPTAVTPTAALQGVIASGVVSVVVDPRTSLLQSLEAILVAELADHDSWEGLIKVAKDAGASNKLRKEFSRALATEDRHLEKVRSWIDAGHELAKSE